MKKLFAALLVFALAFTGCAMAETLSVIATPSPHAEVVRLIEEDLAAAGYELDLIEVTDYVTENPAVAGGDVMINFFQHIPYLDGYNASVSEEEQLAAVIPTHFEPMGIYPGTKTSLDEIAEGDAIAVPNDPTNMTRAFLLLADAGLISVPEGTTLESTVTPDDITGDLNPNGLEFYEANAELIPGLRGDVAFAIINGNNAALAGLNPNPDAAYAETAESAGWRVVCIISGSLDFKVLISIRTCSMGTCTFQNRTAKRSKSASIRRNFSFNAHDLAVFITAHSEVHNKVMTFWMYQK